MVAEVLHFYKVAMALFVGLFSESLLHVNGDTLTGHVRLSLAFVYQLGRTWPFPRTYVPTPRGVAWIQG